MIVEDKYGNINFDVEIALKYTTKKDGISGNFATKAKTLTYVTPAMAKRITGIENFLNTANSAILNGTANSEIVNGLFVTIKYYKKNGNIKLFTIIR